MYWWWIWLHYTINILAAWLCCALISFFISRRNVYHLAGLLFLLYEVGLVVSKVSETSFRGVVTSLHDELPISRF